ncbi:MAG TPA: hypothetical protein VNA14_13340 [Mycobacteriales bacterium]|nr:hypothetical protein [Mycobacteriales bacterium]
MAERSIDTIIRPAAVLSVTAAALILDGLARADVSRGGVWNASSTVWQRYDLPWNGGSGMRGTAVVVGTIAVVYDQPRAHEITIYKVSINEGGVAKGWTTDRLCDDALAWANLTLESCPRAALATPPKFDPFRDDADDDARQALLDPIGSRVTHEDDDLFGTRPIV